MGKSSEGLLDGPTIIDRGIVTLGDPQIVDTESQIQPNGIDLRLNRIYFLQGKTIVPRDGKAKFDGQAHEVEPKDGWFHLKPEQGVYLVDFLESISVKDGYCADIITRSSLVRSGLDVVTGLWDTGFEGKLGGALRLLQPISLEWGCRMAQVLVLPAHFNGLRYTGRYQGSTSQTALTT